jgi:hypothetical protein
MKKSRFGKQQIINILKEAQDDESIEPLNQTVEKRTRAGASGSAMTTSSGIISGSVEFIADEAVGMLRPLSPSTCSNLAARVCVDPSSSARAR